MISKKCAAMLYTLFMAACCCSRNNRIINHGCMGETDNNNNYVYCTTILYTVFVKKKSRNEKYFKNKSSGCRDGLMEALADKVHKQGEHIPQHRYISHNHFYISSSD